MMHKADPAGEPTSMAVREATYTFPRTARLLNAEDFDRVFAARRARKGPSFCVHFRYPEKSENPSNNGATTPEHVAPALSRLGVVVPKKMVKLAVHRNLLKRMARESFRQLRPGMASADLVVRVVAKIPVRRLRQDLPKLRQQLFDLMKATSRQTSVSKPVDPTSVPA